MSTGSRATRRQLAEILADEGVVARDDVDQALQLQKSTGEALGTILLDMNCITPPDIAKVVSIHYQVPFISLGNYDFESKLVTLFKPDFLHKHKIIPFDRVGQMLLLAVAEIPPEKSLAEIPRKTKHKVALYVAYMEEIEKYLNEHCPLPANSDLLKRRQQAAPAKKTKKTEEMSLEAQTLFGEGGVSLTDALDSTWESIFEAVEQKSDDEAKD